MEITVLKAVCAGLRESLTGLRLAEVGESARGEVCLLFKGGGERCNLLINPRPGLPRLHLVSARPQAAREPDPFTQSLRNHILGSEVVSVLQEGLERVVSFRLARKGGETTLVFEMAGKKPGLILVDKDGKVVIAQSYVPISDTAQRPILPGLTYLPPPLPKKLDPYALTEADIEGILRANPGLPVDKALFANIGGISPLIAAEAAAKLERTPEPGEILNTLKALLKRVESGPYEPRIYDTPSGPVLAAFPLRIYEGASLRKFDSMSEAAETYYVELIERQTAITLKTSLLRESKTKLDAAVRKLKAIESDIARADRAEEYQLMGQLLMASLGSVPRDAESVTLPDLFSESGGPVTIPLDPKLSPVQNAESYFRKSKKAKSSPAPNAAPSRVRRSILPKCAPRAAR